MSSRQIALLSLVAVVIGVIFAGIQLYPIFFNRPASSSPTSNSSPSNPSENKVTTGDANCSAIGNSGGQVRVDCSHNVNISSAASQNPIQKIVMTLDSDDPKSIENFSKTIDSYDNKIVRLSLRFQGDVGSNLGQEDEDKRIVWTVNNPCPNSDSPSDCGGTEYVFNFHDGGEYYSCSLGWCIDGYFSIQPVQGVHQGFVSIGIVGISDSQARLADPSAR